MTNPIPDGKYRVVTGKGDYFVTVKSASVSIDGAIGPESGAPVKWNQNDYARVYSKISSPEAWLPLEGEDFYPSLERESPIESAKREAAIRNARDFGTDPSWYGQ